MSDKQIVVWGYNGVILGNNKECTMENMTESQANIMLSDRSWEHKCVQCRLLWRKHLSTGTLERLTGDRSAEAEAKAGQRQR